MEQLLEHSDSVYRQTVEVALELEEIREKLKKIEDEEVRKLEELRLMKGRLRNTSKNENALSTRSMVMREKITELEEQVKEEAQDISNEMKSFFKKLGLRVQLERRDDLPATLYELRIQFTDNKNYTAIFVYDSVTQDYDLFELQPEHPKFHDLRQMLRDTKDFRGFMYNYREKVRKMSFVAKENETS